MRNANIGAIANDSDLCRQTANLCPWILVTWGSRRTGLKQSVTCEHAETQIKAVANDSDPCEETANLCALTLVTCEN